MWTEFLKNSFLFQGLKQADLETLLKNNEPTFASYKRGDRIYSSTDKKLVGFVVSGKCEIRRIKPDGSKTVLNSLSTHQSFGILSIFSSEEFPTQIFALTNCEILYFTDAQIEHFVNNNLQISKNLINFLAGRINFLNKKIATFSGTRVEDRLAAFILCEREKYGEDSFSFNCQKTAEEINAGRASVYRALTSLEEQGFVTIDNKKIYIKDQKGLERMTK